MPYTTTITSKGTTTIPLPIRKQLGLKPGMKILFEQNNTGAFFIKRPITVAEAREKNQVYMQQHNIRPKSDQELADAAAKAWAKE
jgi:AbrB family looped-hinge helix DNA binding protein